MKNKIDHKPHYLLLVAIGVLIFATSGFGQTTTDSLMVSGLKDTVSVRRDARSIPYIEAKNDADLYFAQGFETARDRLWQMDLLRRVARGELAEIFGRPVLEQDKRWRRFGFAAICEAGLQGADPVFHRALNDYARGVNAFIATLDKETLPIEFKILQYEPRAWTPADSLVVGKILADGLSTTWFEDVQRLNLQKLPKEKFEEITNTVNKDDVVLYGKDSAVSREKAEVVDDKFGADLAKIAAVEKDVRKSSLERVGLYAEDLAASNNWVISGKRTADGKAILANDPHLPPTAPGIWYLTHLSAPNLRVAGVSIPGIPGIVLGHNGSIAWGATNVGPDVQDIYLEEFNDRGEYKTPDGWKKPSIRQEVIKFRPEAGSPKLETETLDVVETRNGVIFNELDGKKIALKWTARDPLNSEFEAFYLLNRASNWTEFKNALKTYGGASQNFVYADTKGDIGWHVGGKIPLRRKGFGELPYDGSTSDGDWVGSIPFDELPHLFNPPDGFIVTANQRIAGTDYKYKQLTRQFAPPWRARRIYELIKANSKITMSDVSDIQYDVFNIPLTEFARQIVRREAASPETLALLKGWDGRMTADSKTALIVNEINTCAGNAVAAENPPAESWDIRQSILPPALEKEDKLWLPKKFENWNALLKSCEVDSLEKLRSDSRFGQKMEDWRWGVYRPAQFSHPLSVVPLIGGRFKVGFTNVNGSSQTPNVGQNVSMRFVAEPGRWDETRHVIPLGQSGDTQSKHWNDQFEAWNSGLPQIFAFTEPAVGRATATILIMKPE